jgi:diketogulonate reductase-like aldo/keto reductase
MLRNLVRSTRRVTILTNSIVSATPKRNMSEAKNDVPALTLKATGDAFPLIGFGTWKAAPGVVREVVYEAIKAGYRHLDCACDYGNEVEVGEGIKRALDEGLCTRKDLFITSKLWNTFHAKEHVEVGCKKSLADLGLDYLDLYLIHFPISLKFVPIETRYPPEWIHDPSTANPKMEYANVPIHETWEGMEGLVAKGLVRNIGISNFNAQSIMDLVKYAKVFPSVLQIELHPYLVQSVLVEYCQKIGIAVTGYSPLGSSSYIPLKMDKGQGVGLLEEPTVVRIAGKYKKSTAQVLLRWGVQRNVSVIPKSSKVDRLKENFNIFDFQLTAEEVAEISALDRNLRYNDPGEFCKGMGGSYPIYA